MKKTPSCARSFAAKPAALVVLCLCALRTVTLEAAAAAPTEPAPVVRLVTAEQGRAIVDAALEQPARGAQDCSHLVHEIYSLAGYEYTYASSFELYAGHASFRRVRYPQAGDLIAWRGHVGVVLEPRQHTFYSLVRSGLQAEDYTGPYWRSRGRPRFYRYVVGPRIGVETAQARHASPPRTATARSNDASVVAQRSEPDLRSSKPAIQEASERIPVVASREAGADKSAEPPTSSILVSTEQRKPTADEIAGGISELSNTQANVLQTDEPLRLQEPLVIFDELRVDRVEIKRDTGWARLQIDSHVRLAADGADFKHRHEKVRWELRRAENGWTALVPAAPRYVSRDAAVRVLASQLAQMTQSDRAAQHEGVIIGQEARIANLLGALLEK
jgi:hypothetical protein